MYYFLNAISTNLTYGQIEQLQFIRVRASYAGWQALNEGLKNT